MLAILLLPSYAMATEATPEEVVSTLWRALSNEAGGTADLSALRRIFHEDAVIFGGRYRDGAPVVKRSEVTAFLEPFARVKERGFHECEVSRSVHAYDRFAVVYSVVESREDQAAALPDVVGVNSIQLYKVGSRWKILSLYYHLERDGLPVPLDAGHSGRCMK